MHPSASTFDSIDPAFLEQMRQVGDPLADGVIRRVLEEGDIALVNRILATLRLNSDPDPTDMPQYLRDYLDATSALPAWMDQQQIDIAENLFWEYGAPMITALFCASLPYCYMAKKGVQVLELTARLASNPTRRVLETAQFLVDGLSPGGLGPQGRGARAVQKVRLLHGMIRAQVLASGQWNPDWDVPINQEDLAGTLMSFSTVVLDSVLKLDFRLSSEEQEAYLHFWKVIGHQLGVDPQLVPPDMGSARRLTDMIQRHQAGDCPEGRFMTAKLIEMMQQHVPLAIFEHVPAMLMRHLLGTQWTDLIGVEAPEIEEALAGFVEFLARPFLEGSGFLLRTAVNEYFNQHLIKGLIDQGLEGKHAEFRLPDELRGKWGIG